MPVLSPRLKFLDKLCRSAGQKLRRSFLDLERQPYGTSDHDKTLRGGLQAVIELFKEQLTTSYPDEALVIKGMHTEAPTAWFIDPCGSLENLQHAREPICFVMAHYLKGKVQQGMIYLPLQDEAYHVAHGEGSWGPRTRLRIGGHQDLNPQCVIGLHDVEAPTLAGVANTGVKLRQSGVALWEVAQLAAGQSDGAVIDKILPAEAELAALMVMEAGGMVTDRFGKPIDSQSTSLVAANSKLHAKLLRSLQGK